MSDDGDEWTSLPLREATRDRFRTHRPQEASSADAFLNTLLDEYDGEFDYDTEAIMERLGSLEDIAGANNVQREEFRQAIEGLESELDDVERAAKEATSAAQSAEQAINEVVDR